MIADAIVRWTARLFVVCYVGRLCLDAARRQDLKSQSLARAIWTAGCLFYVIHVAAAFHFVHGWSHAVAYEHVRLRSLDEAGLNSGIGLFVNYTFGLIWILDTILWWSGLEWSKRRAPYWTVQGFFAFLVSQATVVFGPRFWIPISIGVVVLLIILSRNSRPDGTVDHA